MVVDIILVFLAYERVHMRFIYLYGYSEWGLRCSGEFWIGFRLILESANFVGAADIAFAMFCLHLQVPHL